MQPVLVIVSGPPASGKTTISRKIAEELTLPLFSKDSLKESLFDSMGYSDRAWSKKLGSAAIELMYLTADIELTAGRSIVLECNFKPEFDQERLRALITRHHVGLIQVACSADGAVLFERFERRAKSGERHPGHADANNLEEFRKNFAAGKHGRLDVGGELVEIDTTDFEGVQMERIVQQVRDFCSRATP